ncbi:MAG: replication-associated recombination protein A [archaeon]|nr:replication-associated recombination protein A [archaeon]MCR4323411.1 replication-associated recombination protein A [Nanoarchaeota archaeon]
MKVNSNSPLAYRIRPRVIDEVIGQEALLGMGKPLRIMLEDNKLPGSVILWGPPGCGKTTLARLMSKLVGYDLVEISAVRAGKADIERAINSSRLMGKKTILFVDEIHRFNKLQQDFLLPFVESGVITLVGATTENPSFEVISPLLSRSRVFILQSLNEGDLLSILNRAINHPEGINDVNINEDNKKLIANLSNGDARAALNILELVSSLTKGKEVTKEIILTSVQKSLRYDKGGEEHYNIISAMHKSLRDSDVQASIYWTMRMIEAGEDPEYIIRRMIRFASEDIGNADPNALGVAVNAMHSVRFLGYPECNTALIQCAIYLANAPKSNKVYEAVNKAKEVIKRTGNLGVPLNIRNAPTQFMKNIGYGGGYRYAHDFKDAKVEQEHLPSEIKDEVFYEPTDRGFEGEMKRKRDVREER